MMQFMQKILFCWEYKGGVQSSQTECDLKIEYSVLRNGKDGVKGSADWMYCTLYFGGTYFGVNLSNDALATPSVKKL